ncbi:MAG: homoserine O-acetyltransferase [Phycisphaerales bacterium]|nr:homoserine O-acetyltransferase [Phycisphaerales bacterium]
MSTILQTDTVALPGWTCATRRIASPDNPLKLERGGEFEDASLTYEVFGPKPPHEAESVVLVCHALTGDSHVARAEHAGQASADPLGRDPARRGWWETIVGPGRAIDTRRHTVVCANVLGGCAGSTGPASVDPATGVPYGPRFPKVTVGDIVEAQARLIDALGVSRPITVLGGSIGGFQALEWALRFPERVRAAGVVAAGTRLDAQGIAFNEVGRAAILADPKFRGGDYPQDDPPTDGLGVARRLAHLTYRSPGSLDRRFGRDRTTNGDRYLVERYLDERAERFVRRFDANSYILLTRAMDAYDAGEGRSLCEALRRFKGDLLTVGFSSDWLFPPHLSLELSHLAKAAGVRTRAELVHSGDGHDAFLLPSDHLSRIVGDFVKGWKR